MFIFLICQRYREKCELGAEAPAVEVPVITSHSKAALNQYDFLSNKISVYFLTPCQVVLLYVLKHVLMFRASKILMDTDAVMLEMEVKFLGIPTEILIAIRLQLQI
jgi:hypothetical protein